MNDISDDEVMRRLNEIARADAPMRSPQCEGRNRGHRCPATAVKLVRLHRWGDCTGEPDDADDAARIDPDGNVTAYMCGSCAGYALMAGWKQIRTLEERIPRNLWPITCPTCHRPTTRGTDLVMIEEITR
jgi:hypothetical protein